MTQTAFKEYSDNAIAAIANAGDLNNTTNPVTLSLASGKGALFATITNGQYVTIWDRTTYPDPSDDPNAEKATITARTGDSITLSRPAAVAHTGTPSIGSLWRKQGVDDIQAAINTAEADIDAAEALIALKQTLMGSVVVASSGGDYTTIAAALTAGAKSIYIKGSITQSAALTISQTNVCIWSDRSGNGTIVLSSTTNVFTLSGADSGFSGITFDINSTSNFAGADDAFFTISGARNFIYDCNFQMDGMTTATTGNVIFAQNATSTIINRNTFYDGRALRAIICPPAQNRRGMIANNLFHNFQNISPIYSVTTTVQLMGVILGNDFICAGMTVSKDIIHYETTSSGGFAQGILANNRLICSGTFAATSLNGIRILAISATVSSQQGITVANNVVFSGSSNTIFDFGLMMTNCNWANVSGNLFGEVRMYGGLQINFTGNTCYSFTADSNNQREHNMVGNTFYNTVALGAFTQSNFSNNRGGNQGAFTMNSSSNNSIISGNECWTGMTIDGTYHLVFGNAGAASTSSAEWTGTLTINGNHHQVENNRFAALTNTNFTSLVNGRYKTDITAVGNVGTGEDTLITYNLPASAMKTNKDTAEIDVMGTYAANANNKTVKLYFGTQVIMDSGALAINGGSWRIQAKVIRLSATTQECVATMTTDNALLVAKTTRTAGTQTVTSAVTIKCTGEATSNDDISQKFMEVKFTPES